MQIYNYEYEFPIIWNENKKIAVKNLQQFIKLKIYQTKQGLLAQRS